MANPYGLPVFKPPPTNVVGSFYGDPHYVGFDGKSYDVFPVGDAVVLQAPDNSLVIHAKHERYPLRSGPSYATAIVIKISEFIFEYQAKTRKFYVNKHPFELPKGGQYFKPDISVLGDMNNFDIRTDFSNIRIGVRNAGGWTISASISIPRTLAEKCAPGLLGNLIGGQGRVVPARGLFIREDVNERELQVPTDQFQNIRVVDTPPFPIVPPRQQKSYASISVLANTYNIPVSPSESSYMQPRLSYEPERAPQRLSERLESSLAQVADKVVEANLRFDYENTPPEIRDEVINSTLVAVQEQIADRENLRLTIAAALPVEQGYLERLEKRVTELERALDFDTREFSHSDGRLEKLEKRIAALEARVQQRR